MSNSVSVHVDGYYGLKYGVTNLLELFKKYNIKATFFVNMGREAGIFKILKYRTKELKKSDKEIVNRYSKIQMLRMLFFPRALGYKNCKILKQIKDAGHEVNPHCWSHLLWSKNFDKMDIENQIKKMKESFVRCLNQEPTGFAPPTWKWNSRVIDFLKKAGFSYISTNNAKFSKITKSNGITLIPLTYDKTPEEMLNEGMSEKEVIKYYKEKVIKKEFNIYFHADYEGIRGLKLTEEILKLINPKTLKTYTEIVSANEK